MSGYKEFVDDTVLTAADVNAYLMQGVMVFDSTAARGSAIASPSEGMMSYLKDANATQVYTGTTWQTLSNPTAVVGSTAGTVAASSYTDAGVTYDVYTFTGAGTATIDTAGYAEVLLVGGGAYGPGNGGDVVRGMFLLPAEALAVTVGAGGTVGSTFGNPSSIGTLTTAFSSTVAGSATSSGAGGTAGDKKLGLTSTITGASVTYAAASVVTPGTNTGNGGGAATNGSAGVVIIRVPR